MSYIIGLDEVGYGAGAFNLVVCGVRALNTWSLIGLNDSKKLSPLRREELSKQLKDISRTKEIEYVIAQRSAQYIDTAGLGVALKECYIELIKLLAVNIDDEIIMDGNLKLKDPDINHLNIKSLVKADNIIPQVMAASIIAKVYRDKHMTILSKKYPEYGFENHFGYLTKEHLDNIKKFGPCEIHRYSYKTFKNYKRK